MQWRILSLWALYIYSVKILASNGNRVFWMLGKVAYLACIGRSFTCFCSVFRYWKGPPSPVPREGTVSPPPPPAGGWLKKRTVREMTLSSPQSLVNTWAWGKRAPALVLRALAPVLWAPTPHLPSPELTPVHQQALLWVFGKSKRKLTVSLIRISGLKNTQQQLNFIHACTWCR